MNMRGLCMMYADRQTYLTQPGPGINHPVLHLKRESHVHRGVSNLLGIRDTRKQRTLQGMNHQSSCWGRELSQTRSTTPPTLLGNLSEEIKDLSGSTTKYRSCPKRSKLLRKKDCYSAEGKIGDSQQAIHLVG